METCTLNATHDSYFMKSTPALHYKAASDGDSPDASMPMGNLSSPLVDSGYREGSVTYYCSQSNSNNSLIEEGPPATAGPPVITPVSGQLEKYKQHRMIRPVPLKAISPSRSLDSPSSTSSKHSLPSSPSSMPDHINGRPPLKPQQQQQQQNKQQPPDVVLTNQKRNFAGNHFGAPPTKCLSLQDITPKQKGYQGNSAQRPPQNYAKAWGKQMAQQRHIQPAHSLNYLNRSIQNLQNQQKLLPDYKRRNISQSTTQVNSRNGSSGSPKKPVRINHTNPSYGVVDYNSNRVDNKSSSSASSSKMSFMGAEMTEIGSLRQKVLEKEAQLSTLRDTMDNNEAAILKVHEEKHRTWEEETSWLRKELQEQEDTSRKIRHSLQAQIYKLEQEKKLLREKTDTSQHQQQQHSSANKGVEDLKWQLRNHRDQLSAKAKEIANLRNKLAHQEEQLTERTKTMASLEAELQENRRSNQGSVDFQERLLKEKEAELSETRVETNHMRELKENLAKEVRLQEEELTLLRTKMGTKEKELSQERCEVAYLREVQEKLNQQLQKKGKLGGGLLSGKGSPSGNASQLKEKLMQREKDISLMKDQLRRVQDEKEQEVGKLRQTVKDRSSDIEKLQKKLSETEKDCSLLRNKLSNVKGGTKMTPLQRQLESDFMDMQVKLTTREREVFQMKRELALLQEKSESDVGNLRGRIKEQEKEQQGFQERLRQRETEIGFLMDKMKSRDSQIVLLKEELEKSSRPQVSVQSFQEAQKRALELEKETTTLKNERAELIAQVDDLQDESAMYKSKLDKISLGVRSLSTSQLNLLNLSEGKAAGPGFDANKGPSKSPVDERLKHEMQTLKDDLAGTRKKLQAHEAKMAHERRIWQEEKEKVIKYQKQLQLNYVQMCRRNRSLESDLQQLTLELEHKEISHC
ncbi:golgin subfamily A member 6-like protein 22 [Asterias rubens]|uniref:golgin subfamily A member 6-like protein 22 n=1 Tax=Asterias rubens TaxID=7604 RepID=UPI0014558399|nr:golgin subfamily A member 6-like protein 22 [Asterias rubens]